MGAKVRTSLTEDLDQLKAYRALITDTHNQNFFIVTNTNKEIHMKGYRPSYLYTNYEADSAGEMMEGVPHCIASSGAIPKGSETDGMTNTSLFL